MPFLCPVKLWLVFLFFPLWAVAQQPSHYILGEEELEGIDIYRILQVSDGSYLIATGNGLITYDGYKFTTFPCPDMLRTSVFNLVEDHNGIVYCNNLSGQIFRLNNGICNLFYTIPDSSISSNIGLEIDNLNRLVIKANGLLILDDKATLTDQLSLGHFGQMTRLSDSSLVVYSREKQFAHLKNGSIIFSTETSSSENGNDVWNTVLFQGKEYQNTANSCELYSDWKGKRELVFDPFQITSKKQSYRIYTTDNSMWLAPNSVGIYCFDENLQPANKGKPWFEDMLISYVCEDSEGNVLFGTFGNGIIVIPKESTRDIELPDRDELIISTTSSGDGTLYFGTMTGNVYQQTLGENPKLFREKRAKSMEALYAIGNNKLIIGDQVGVLIDLESGKETILNIGSLKDVAILSTNEVLLATNQGVTRLDVQTGAKTPIKALQVRNYCVGNNLSSGSIYAGTSKGLAILNSDNELSYVSLHGKNIIARDMASTDDVVFVATSNSGILVFKNDTISEEWNVGTGLISNQVNHLEVIENQLFAATDKGIQILSIDGELVRWINRADGLVSENVSDFEVSGEQLWVVHRKGAQTVSLTNYQPFDYYPELKLQRVFVNDSLAVNSERGQFKADEQKFAFQLQVRNLRYQQEIGYQYMLEGAENSWQQNSFRDNLIEYKSLSPGTYKFRAKAVCRNHESSEITYKFTIATPYYMAWWFYALISLVLILGVVLWFRRRLKRHAFLLEQQNELNASKLTAIQSQMNPHFIFNALNSIQDLVLKGDVTNSYTYITKFADLVRRTLNYSDKDFIDFDNELKLIDLYLTLEKLRFKTDFEYEIDASNIEDIQIPPMLIQPFIENALVHGLLHREGEKKLKLKFELNDNLICTITDNGVGRARAKEIRERQRSNHQSFSVNAIKTRFEILKRYYDGNLGFRYDDLNEGGVVVGTRVTLTIPVKRKF